MSAATYAYQAPHRPADYPQQLYYRGTSDSHHLHGSYTQPLALQLYRPADSTTARLKVAVNGDDSEASVAAWLDEATLRTLRNAIDDALTDIAAVREDNERQASFDRISEEMRDRELDGGEHGCYYAHPDIHYVPADQVQAKVAELEAAGCKRYMVLPLEREAAPA